LVEEVLRHVTLALAVLALAHAAVRLADRASPQGVERAIVAVVVAVAAAVIQTLGLGLVGLGGSTIALASATALLWVAALVWLPAPATHPVDEVVRSWTRLKLAGRLAVAAVAGAALAWLAWQLRYPSIGFDSSVYHSPEVAGWIQNGRPGSILDLNHDIPYGNYPLTDEVAQTWGAALARSWVPLALWQPAMLVVLAGAAWQTLRGLSVSVTAAALGTTVIVTTPLVVRQLNEPQTDLPAMTWLACAAALAVGAGRRPQLLVPALIAAGLAIGTKTTVAPLAVAVLCAGALQARGRLRPLAGWLILGLAAAFVVGGIWYARNLFQHGWPLWPFMEAPWGDPRPRFFALLETTFLERPADTLDGRLGEYSSRLGGTWLLLVLAPVILGVGASSALARAKQGPGLILVVSAALALVALLLWSTAWGTGLQRAPEVPGPAGWPISTIRYLLPAVGAAVVAVTATTRMGNPLGPIANVVLVVAVGWSLAVDARLGTPYTPSVPTLLVGALTGLLALSAVLLARRVVDRRIRLHPPAPAVAVLCAAAVGIVLTPVGDGFIERYTRVSQSTAPGAEVVAWFLTQPGFDEGDTPIAFSSRAVFVALAGDHFTHRLDLLPPAARCELVAKRTRRAPVVAVDPAWFAGILGFSPYGGPRCLARRAPGFEEGPYSVYLPRDRFRRSAHHRRREGSTPVVRQEDRE
jgi:hypothetical protein